MIHHINHTIEERELIFEIAVKATYDDIEKTLEDATVFIVARDGTEIDITSALHDRQLSTILNCVHEDLEEYYLED